MNEILFTLSSIVAFFSLFLHCHFVLKFQGTAYTSAKNIQYRYLQMGISFLLLIVLYLTQVLQPFSVWALTLFFSTWYYALRFGVLYKLRWPALFLLLGTSFFYFPQESTFLALVGGLGVSYFVDAIWNRELKKRVLP